METDKVLALAREAGLAVTVSSYDSLHKFAALIRREWVGLTGAEVNHIFAENVGYPERMMKEVEAKLKEKNSGHI